MQTNLWAHCSAFCSQPDETVVQNMQSLKRKLNLGLAILTRQTPALAMKQPKMRSYLSSSPLCPSTRLHRSKLFLNHSSYRRASEGKKESGSMTGNNNIEVGDKAAWNWGGSSIQGEVRRARLAVIVEDLNYMRIPRQSSFFIFR